ncbi:MAG TPA: hypothetical protein PLC17_05065 [Tenuifilaceae bacterium]|nr:hypothetical protein [Tenuifilaceae bacterium]
MIKRLTHLRTVVFILFVVAFVPVKAQSLSAQIKPSGGRLSVCQNSNYSLQGDGFDGTGSYVKHEWEASEGVIFMSHEYVALIRTKNIGVFTVTYRVYDDSGAMAETSITFEVIPIPKANLVKTEAGVEVMLDGTDNVSVVWYNSGNKLPNEGFTLSSPLHGSYCAVVVGSNGCSMRTNKFDFE